MLKRLRVPPPRPPPNPPPPPKPPPPNPPPGPPKPDGPKPPGPPPGTTPGAPWPPSPPCARISSTRVRHSSPLIFAQLELLILPKTATDSVAAATSLPPGVDPAD